MLQKKKKEPIFKVSEEELAGERTHWTDPNLWEEQPVNVPYSPTRALEQAETLESPTVRWRLLNAPFWKYFPGPSGELLRYALTAPGMRAGGTTLGTAGGAKLGALAGSYGGPVGAGLGAILGGVGGGMLGNLGVQGVQQYYPEILGPAPQDPITTAIMDQIFETGGTGIGKVGKWGYDLARAGLSPGRTILKNIGVPLEHQQMVDPFFRVGDTTSRFITPTEGMEKALGYNIPVSAAAATGSPFALMMEREFVEKLPKEFPTGLSGIREQQITGSQQWATDLLSEFNRPWSSRYGRVFPTSTRTEAAEWIAKRFQSTKQARKRLLEAEREDIINRAELLQFTQPLIAGGAPVTIKGPINVKNYLEPYLDELSNELKIALKADIPTAARGKVKELSQAVKTWKKFEVIGIGDALRSYSNIGELLSKRGFEKYVGVRWGEIRKLLGQAIEEGMDRLDPNLGTEWRAWNAKYTEFKDVFVRPSLAKGFAPRMQGFQRESKDYVVAARKSLGSAAQFDELIKATGKENAGTLLMSDMLSRSVNSETGMFDGNAMLKYISTQGPDRRTMFRHVFSPEQRAAINEFIYTMRKIGPETQEGKTMLAVQASQAALGTAAAIPTIGIMSYPVARALGTLGNVAIAGPYLAKLFTDPESTRLLVRMAKASRNAPAGPTWFRRLAARAYKLGVPFTTTTAGDVMINPETLEIEPLNQKEPSLVEKFSHPATGLNRPADQRDPNLW